MAINVFVCSLIAVHVQKSSNQARHLLTPGFLLNEQRRAADRTGHCRRLASEADPRRGGAGRARGQRSRALPRRAVVFSVWCLLLFLLRSQFLHSQTDGPSNFYEEHGRRDSYCKVRPLEAYVLPHHNDSSPTCQSSYSPPQEAAAPPPPSNASNTSSPSPEAAFVGLDEFRSRIMQGKIENDTTGRSAGGGAAHRLEPSGVQGRQGARAQQGGQGRRQHPWWRHKYLRNPCSADDKFVVVELSETIVDTVALANLEHYSSTFSNGWKGTGRGRRILVGDGGSAWHRHRKATRDRWDQGKIVFSNHT
ncbi:membrane protein-like [Panicum miliaceum]|uniref:Membrane protein-like n=1 Tax=Panicum miliaceum TaxID=4540 RepID=A0A3L6S8H5_PANMI|nr:membrane protein-like [Panicum miliaceum]